MYVMKTTFFLLSELVILLKVSFCALGYIYSQVIKLLFIYAAQCLYDNLPVPNVLNEDGWLFDFVSIMIGVLLIKNIHLIGVDFTTFIKVSKKSLVILLIVRRVTKDLKFPIINSVGMHLVLYSIICDSSRDPPQAHKHLCGSCCHWSMCRDSCMEFSSEIKRKITVFAWPCFWIYRSHLSVN